jgi:hypothetical protein
MSTVPPASDRLSPLLLQPFIASALYRRPPDRGELPPPPEEPPLGADVPDGRDEGAGDERGGEYDREPPESVERGLTVVPCGCFCAGRSGVTACRDPLPRGLRCAGADLTSGDALRVFFRPPRTAGWVVAGFPTASGSFAERPVTPGVVADRPARVVDGLSPVGLPSRAGAAVVAARYVPMDVRAVP